MAKIYINNSGYTEVTKVGIKNSGSWVKNAISAIYQKINGIWRNDTFNSGITNYTFGGFIETTPEGGTITSDTAYNPSGTHEPNTDIIYTQTPGQPNVKTDENGNVVEYTFTNTGTTGVTTSNVDTGIIAFDQSNPGWTLHLVAEFTPNLAANKNKNIIQAYDTTNRKGLYVYGYDNYCYKKIQTADSSTNSSFKPWKTLNVTYNQLQTVTFDVTYSNDKKYSLYVNGIEHFSNVSVNYTFSENITIQIAVGMSNFTIKEFTVVKI